MSWGFPSFLPGVSGMWCRDGEDRWHVAVPRVEMTEPAELGAHWVEFGLERRAAQRAPGPGWPRDCLCLAGPGGSLMPVLTCTVATTLSTSCPGWKAPSQLQVSRVEPEAGPQPRTWASFHLSCELLASLAGFWPRALQAPLPVPLIAVCFSSMCGWQRCWPCFEIWLFFKKSFILRLLLLFLFFIYCFAWEVMGQSWCLFPADHSSI